MNVSQIIARKRDGSALSEAEIAEFVCRYAAGEIPDYQMSALAMANRERSTPVATWKTPRMG